MKLIRFLELFKKSISIHCILYSVSVAIYYFTCYRGKICRTWNVSESFSDLMKAEKHIRHTINRSVEISAVLEHSSTIDHMIKFCKSSVFSNWLDSITDSVGSTVIIKWNIHREAIKLKSTWCQYRFYFMDMRSYW